MPEIKTQEDWWHHYNRNLDHLIDIVGDYVGREYTEGLTFEEVAQQMEDWGKEEKYSEKLFSYLNSSWFHAPEKGCREIPGWFVLCDLCSENWVFYEEEMAE